MEYTRDTRIIDLTLGQFTEWMKEMGFEAKKPAEHKNYVYGLSGIMSLFGCKKSKAQRLKDGLLAPAVSQNGKLIVVDADKAMELFNQQK